MNLKQIMLLAFLILCSTAVNADTISVTSGSSSLGISSNSNRLRITSLDDTVSYYDQELGRFIIITNTRNNAELRIVITDQSHNPLKVFKVAESSLIIPYSINAVDFYPSYSSNGSIKPGILIISTSRGDLIVDSYNLKSKFVVFNRDYFSGSSYETIPVQETKQIKGL